MTGDLPEQERVLDLTPHGQHFLAGTTDRKRLTTWWHVWHGGTGKYVGATNDLTLLAPLLDGPK